MAHQTTLVLGSNRDYHAHHMLHACRKHGIRGHLFDTSDYPGNIALSWDPVMASGSLHLPDTELAFEQIDSVFWSSICPAKVQPPQQQAYIVHYDNQGMLRTFFDYRDIDWINSWHAFQSHMVKPQQLASAARIGLLIPPTYIGNHIRAIQAFTRQQHKIIYKPVYGGATARLVDPEHTRTDHLSHALSLCPVTLQHFVEGTNIRTFVMDNQVFSAEIISQHADFRTDSEVKVIPHHLPGTVAIRSIQLCRALDMRWTAIDWRMTDSGEYYFLEANPSPMFIFLEQQTGFPLTESLVRMLAGEVLD